jgi:uncharacterized protein YbcV (DUF1398 family)
VVRYDSFVTDGHSEYIGQDTYRVVWGAIHERLTIAANGIRESFLGHFDGHQPGETRYLYMSRGLADSGIEGWTVDTQEMTTTFYDHSGEALLVEKIK